MNCAKIVVPIEMQFGMLSWVAPVLDVLNGCILVQPGKYD